MKNKIFVLLAMATLFFVLVVPVMAAPAQRVDASCASTSVPYYRTYSGDPSVEVNSLTKMCADYGLSSNPYPVPPTATAWYTPNDNTFHRHDGSGYLKITDLMIGNEHHTGISCNTLDGFRNIAQGIMLLHYNAIWYINDGVLSELSSGFKGNIEFRLTGYQTQDPDWYSVHCVLQGFGDYEGYTLKLSLDAQSNAAWTGTCVIK